MEIFSYPRKYVLMLAVAVAVVATLATAQDTEHGFTPDVLRAKSRQENSVVQEKKQTVSQPTEHEKKTASAPGDEKQGASVDSNTSEDIDLQPKQEMVSFTFNLPISSLEGAAAGDFFFGDMLSSFGSLFSRLFSVDDWDDEEIDSSRNSVSPASAGVPTAGSYGLAPTSPASSVVSTSGGSLSSFARVFGDAESHAFGPTGHEEGESVYQGDEAFLPFLTSAYLLPGVQSLLSSMMMVPFSDAFSVSFENGVPKAAGANGAGGKEDGASFGIINLFSNLMQASPESLVGPEILSHITDENCLFEVDLHSLPETASITVGVEGDAVFVEYSNTFSETSDVAAADDTDESDFEEPTADLSGKTDKSDSKGEGKGPEESITAEALSEATGAQQSEPLGKADKKTSRQNLRGTVGAAANVYSYERFVIDPVCDYESADARAARVEDDLLMIKFPLKKAHKQQTRDRQDNERKNPKQSDKKKAADRLSSNTENVSDPQILSHEAEKKTEDTNKETTSQKKEEHKVDAEAEQVLQSNRHNSAPKRLVEVSRLQSSHPRRRILPLVAAQEF
ncbi:hypothetical protein TGRUB_297410 [Toxoplasma gondii RUB]|uniref:Transmembrane protein n=1 Tax=Toxoplasma gondii RUB TaxID=935652 RepID=A0A086LXB6_TOXGO|nr:hypothetical protein TGRUB_297410 [Toxoplasma gondii RUB]